MDVTLVLKTQFILIVVFSTTLPNVVHTSNLHG